MAKPRIERRFYFRDWARAKNKRQRDVAAFTGLNKSYVSLLWSGKKEPGPDTLARIAAAIGVPPAALLMHPTEPRARALAAMDRIPKEQQETAVEMLEGLADRRRA